MRLNPKFNCFALEHHITHVDTGRKYVNTRPFFRGSGIAIRHFAGSQEDQKPCKSILDSILPFLETDKILDEITRKNVSSVERS
jgi:hypothetical protein